MLAKTGVATESELAGVLPPAERLRQGPVAVIECLQQIPCNPCYYACRRGAIQPFADINDRPQIDTTRCNGCGLCATKCPGLAIFIVDMTYRPDMALVKLPYEFLPLPAEGGKVTALDRAGQPVGPARVVKVQDGPEQNRTRVIWLLVPKALALTVRHIRVKEGTGDGRSDDYLPL